MLAFDLGPSNLHSKYSYPRGHLPAQTLTLLPLPLPAECWEFKCKPPYPVYVVLESQVQDSSALRLLSFTIYCMSAPNLRDPAPSQF